MDPAAVDTAAVVIALMGIVLSFFTVINAVRRALIFWGEFDAAKKEKSPGPFYAVELQTAGDLFWGQAIRVIGYLAIFLIFGSFLSVVFPQVPFSGSRAGRVILTAITLSAFFVEENYLIRAKRHWAEMLKEVRNGGP